MAAAGSLEPLGPEVLRTAVSLDAVESLAEQVLPSDVRDFVAGGSGAEATLSANRAALDRISVVPNVLRDVSGCTAATTLLGDSVSMPVAVAPAAYQRLVHPEGELAAARAAKAHGVPFTVSTLSSYPVEAVAATGAAVWFQLYWLRDRRKSFELVKRAEDAGCTALMLTVDVPWMGRRPRDVRNGFALPPGVEAAHLRSGTPSRSHDASSGGSAVAAHTASVFEPSLTWADVEDLRARTRLPLILKGILAPEDAARAVDCGADAVVVSNHGGRQLDGAIPSVDALEDVSVAVAGRCRVLLDSGIRSGIDVLRALALGADGVLVGRPVLWGLAAAGEAGAGHVLGILAAELRDALGLSGCDGVAAARRIRTVRSTTWTDR
ncbi:alpha-hydroxy acid oxidase [Streptomyces sp. NPDC007095]|uniref:alpha-hydroxy acid oxidase n=1 Tax=Streptomyces sp. NPDC007095 TaxID=3154482 RepID=UPI0033F1D7ED